MRQDISSIDSFLLPFKLFSKKASSGGIVLLFVTIFALIWANSPWHETYFHIWESKFTVGFEKFSISKPIHIWINDGLMAMFFFVVGLEIKREILAGELSSFKQAAFPIAAAIGGMLVPALIFVIFNMGTATNHGWGVPMATDIAFALAILSVLGNRVPISLKIFLTALAIVDDLGAVLVIALFYSSEIYFSNLALGAAFLAGLIACNIIGVRNPLIYGILGIGGLWTAFLFSGIHPTIAGVLSALTIPARTKIDSNEFRTSTAEILEEFDRPDEQGENVTLGKNRLSALLRLKIAYENATTPLQRIEKTLHPWVIFVVMPIFALANAGVRLGNLTWDSILNPLSVGIILGLVIGKQIGITLGAWIAVRIGLATLPKNVTWLSVYMVSWLGGVGFTMSLFISTLAFENEQLLQNAKASVLLASLISGGFGFALLKLFLRKS